MSTFNEHVRRELLTVKEAADVLGLGRTFVYSLVMAGQILSVKIGRARRIPRHCLDAYISGLIKDQS